MDTVLFKYRSNARGKVHAFVMCGKVSICGWVTLDDTTPSSRPQFLVRSCPPCRRNFAGDRRGSCARCGLSHMSLSGVPQKKRVAFLRRRDGDVCSLCDLPIDFSANSSRWTRPSVDHIIERRNGGCTHPDNLRLLHVFCNSARERFADPRLHPKYAECVTQMIEDAWSANPASSTVA